MKFFSLYKKVINRLSDQRVSSPVLSFDAPGFYGPFKDWNEAQKQCTGYDNQVILEKVSSALQRVKNGEAAYERDSVVFEKHEYVWPILAVLLGVAVSKNSLQVLDFGGSLGSTYFQHRNWLHRIQKLSWNIVEQARFVEYGKKYFQSDKLKFYGSIEDCIAAQVPDVILLASVLPYLENPFFWINRLTQTECQFIIVDRTGFIEGNSDFLSVQVVPETIYRASYPAWFFNEKLFIEYFNNVGYHLSAHFDSAVTPPIILAGKNARWKGFIFEKIN